jgi:hypothetical protein
MALFRHSNPDTLKHYLDNLAKLAPKTSRALADDYGPSADGGASTGDAPASSRGRGAGGPQPAGSKRAGTGRSSGSKRRADATAAAAYRRKLRAGRLRRRPAWLEQPAARRSELEA